MDNELSCLQESSNAIYEKRDELIKDAINSVIGNEWSESDIKDRGELLITPEKTTFIFDGNELLYLHPVESDSKTIGKQHKLKYTFNYQKLY